MLEVASGKLPKLGLKFELGEQEMKNIDALIRQPNANMQLVINNVFSDTPRVISAVYEAIEDMFLRGLSTGVALRERNDGTGVRISYGYRSENKFGVTKLWTEEDATPISDIERLIDKARLEDGNTPRHLFADDFWLRSFYKNKEVREQYAFDQNFVGTNVPSLNFDKAASVLLSRFDVQLHRVSKSVKTEVGGVVKTHKPWQEGMGVFSCDDKLGDLVWTDVAEASRPVNGVVYQNADDYILCSKYSVNDPLREYTAAQAMVAPIISNVDSIYQLNTKEVQV